MGQTSIILGNNTLTGVDTIKLTNATDTTAKVDFTYGVTPSGTINVKLGNTTLTGVNEISILGADSTYKSFGYAAQASGYTVQITTSINDSDETNNALYSLDDGATWVTLYDAGAYPSKTITLNNVTQIKFKVGNPNLANWGVIQSTQLGLTIIGDDGEELSQNYVLTQDITDIQAYTFYD